MLFHKFWVPQVPDFGTWDTSTANSPHLCSPTKNSCVILTIADFQAEGRTCFCTCFSLLPTPCSLLFGPYFSATCLSSAFNGNAISTVPVRFDIISRTASRI